MGTHCLIQPLKRKSAAANYGQGVGDQNPVSEYANVNSPVQTPMSGKAGNTQKIPKTSKARSASQAVASNAGEGFRCKSFSLKCLCTYFTFQGAFSIVILLPSVSQYLIIAVPPSLLSHNPYLSCSLC